MVMHFVVSGT